jgi:L-lactate dehydrogenase (cytochrome)
MIGRAYIYGLGANGEAGVAKAIDILKKELDVAMALTGVKSIDEIGPHVLADSELRNSVKSPKPRKRR